jgi:hypothetical protein
MFATLITQDADYFSRLNTCSKYYKDAIDRSDGFIVEANSLEMAVAALREARRVKAAFMPLSREYFGEPRIVEIPATCGYYIAFLWQSSDDVERILGIFPDDLRPLFQ